MSVFVSPSFLWHQEPSKVLLGVLSLAVMSTTGLMFIPLVEVPESFLCLMLASLSLVPACAQAHQAVLESHSIAKSCEVARVA